VTNASATLIKYCVNGLSPGRFSCGIMLSTTHTTRVCLFFLAFFSIVPNAGPINGSQYLTTIRSYFFLFISLPTCIQLNGFTELTVVCMVSPLGAGSSVNWVLPGNK